MNIRIGTFNLFQFVKPPHSYYEKKDRFTTEQWNSKYNWISNQIKKMDCDIIGFQEVFSQEELKELTNELGFKYFQTVDTPRVDKKDEYIYITTTVAIASKYPIENVHKVNPHIKSLKKHKFKRHFRFSRVPVKVDIKFKEEFITTFYVCHLKSNRENEFEYVFNANSTLKEKKESINKALDLNFSESLRIRLCEASSLFFDMKKQKYPFILLCDLNDKEFSATIEALTNEKYHNDSKKEHKILNDAYYQHKRKIYNPHPEQKELKRPPTSFFAGKGNVLDYIFVSKHFIKSYKESIAKIENYEILDEEIQKHPDGSILTSDHAQVVCEVKVL